MSRAVKGNGGLGSVRMKKLIDWETLDKLLGSGESDCINCRGGGCSTNICPIWNAIPDAPEMRWIPVGEHLPENLKIQKVWLVPPEKYNNKKPIETYGNYNNHWKEWRLDGYELWLNYGWTVTHWSPIPDLGEPGEE